MPKRTTESESGADSAFGRDVARLTVVRLAAVAAGFVVNVIAARILGAAALGAAGLGLTIATVAALFSNGGLNIAAIYFLGQRPDERPAIVRRIFALGLIAAVLACIVAVLVAMLLASLLEPFSGELVTASAALAAAIIAFEISGSVLLGLGMRDAYVRTQIIEGVGSLAIAAFVLVLVSPTSAGLVAAAGLAYAAAALYAGATARRVIHPPLLAFNARFAREALTLGIRGQVGNLLQFLNLRLDLLLIPLFVDLRAAGVYLVAVRMSEVVTQLASASAAFLFPAVAEQSEAGSQLTERTVRMTLAVVLVVGAGIAILGDLLLSTFFGSEFSAGSSALRITMVAMIPLSLTRLLAGDLKGRGRPGAVSIAAAFSLVATLLLNPILIPALGIEGAAVASLAAYTVGAGLLLLTFRRVTGRSIMMLVPNHNDAAAVLRAALTWLRKLA